MSSHPKASGSSSSNSTPKKSSKGPPPGGKRPAHTKPDDVLNISNGIQRLQLGGPLAGKHGHAHPRSPPARQPRPQPQADKAGSRVGRARPRSTGDAAFAKTGLYAGAAFDLSPAASSLPIPKFTARAAAPAGGMHPISVEALMRSGQAASCPSAGARAPAAARASEAEQLRVKSEHLRRLLTIGQPAPHPSREAPPNTEQLEEMTAEVRRLLNL